MNKIMLLGTAILIPLGLAYLAYARPGYFNSRSCQVVLLVECLIAAVCAYRRAFFPVMLVVFLLAGVDLPVGPGWSAARWLFLGIGAFAGSLIVLKERSTHFGVFHVLASFAVLTAVVSASVSNYPVIALLKTVSLFLLFLYGATGARLAAIGREDRFFTRLLAGVEIFVFANAVLSAVGIQALGNPNSIGAVMGMFGAPILLWGALVRDEPFAQHRRWVLYGICMYMTFTSHARAGLAAALLSCGLLCLALRRYKLIIEGVVILLILLAAVAILRPGYISSVASSVIYKKGDQGEGLLFSRFDPWRMAINNIRDHPWFGMGLGTTASGKDASEGQGRFASSTGVTAENGSSYLAITAGVGLLGTPPFFFLLALLVRNILRTVKWMLKTRSPSHPAVPLAMVMLAGLVHAAFEDWMFAPGNYLCVFFWSLAFIFADVAPSRVPTSAPAWSRNLPQAGYSEAATST